MVAVVGASSFLSRLSVTNELEPLRRQLLLLLCTFPFIPRLGLIKIRLAASGCNQGRLSFSLSPYPLPNSR